MEGGKYFLIRVISLGGVSILLQTETDMLANSEDPDEMAHYKLSNQELFFANTPIYNN